VPRSLLAAAGLGLAVATVMFVLVASLLTMPLFALARFTEAETALHRPWFTTGLEIAGGIGATIGVISGIWIGRYFRRGGRFELPEPPP
jgi:hypothetical protein